MIEKKTFIRRAFDAMIEARSREAERYARNYAHFSGLDERK
ncbi:hypothetical protein [Cucumibacter marinus]|nr:hypothetical protein [Cucumibacter marinus]